MKYYKISEEKLLKLLTSTERLNCLECNGVDNWFGYMDNRTEYIAYCLNVSEEKVEEEDLDFIDIAKNELNEYELLKEN